MPTVTGKSTFALFFGNRGFFPASLLAAARQEMVETLAALGHKTIIMDADATRHGAVETIAEGAKYAQFLQDHAGEFDGVILSLPNFGDENGAVTALRDARVPIYVQAYPDDLDKMGPALRRDAFCGKLSVTDVFIQNNVKFTALKPHTVSPGTPAFAAQIDYFDKVCRVVKSLKGMRLGSIGARVTAFKTVRIDEVAMQKHGITVESYDLSEVFGRMNGIAEDGDSFKAKAERLRNYTDFSAVPAEIFARMVKVSVAIDDMVSEYGLDAIALRCWMEMQTQIGISPCVLLSEMNDRKFTGACEVDLGNAVMMHAFTSATGDVPACLDWNNNYGDDDDKCILFHCGPIPQSMMTCKGTVKQHSMMLDSPGVCTSYGCNEGRIAPSPFTFGSLMTDAGRLKIYLGDGEFTDDPIAPDYFGCGGVAKIDRLQDVLMHVVRTGHRHHVSATRGVMVDPVKEAFENYLGCDVTIPQKG